MEDLYEDDSFYRPLVKDFSEIKSNKPNNSNLKLKISIPENYKFIKGAFLVVYAPWCSHCRNQEPLWTSINNEFNLIYPIFVLNGDDKIYSKIIDNLGVEAFPSVFTIKPGGEINRFLNDINNESIRLYIWSKIQ